MTDDQLRSAVLAFAIGIGLAIVLFVPFVFLNYRRNGHLTWGRTVLWVAFLVYVMALWTYTLLPLPDPGAILCVRPQLHPLNFLDEIRAEPHRSVRQLYHNWGFMQFALNVALFVPLGFLMRWLFHRGIVVTTLLGFAASCAIEITQYTGVWGIYPCAYRYFDVDDLLANTLGALGGAIMAALAYYSTGGNAVWRGHGARTGGEPRRTVVTAGRRLLGMACDLITVWFLAVVAGVVTGLLGSDALGKGSLTRSAAADSFTLEPGTDLWAFWLPFIITALITLSSGRTPGDWAVRIRFTPEGTAPARRLLHRLLRFLAGIGGYQLLTLIPGPWALVFVAACLITSVVVPGQGGLAGLVTRANPADDVKVGRR